MATRVRGKVIIHKRLHLNRLGLGFEPTPRNFTFFTFQLFHASFLGILSTVYESLRPTTWLSPRSKSLGPTKPNKKWRWSLWCLSEKAGFATSDLCVCGFRQNGKAHPPELSTAAFTMLTLRHWKSCTFASHSNVTDDQAWTVCTREEVSVYQSEVRSSTSTKKTRGQTYR